MRKYYAAVGFQKKKIFKEVYLILHENTPVSRKIKRIINRYINTYDPLLEVEDVLHECIMEFLSQYVPKDSDAPEDQFLPWFLNCVNNWCKDKIYKKNIRIVTHQDGSHEKIRRFTSLDQMNQYEDGEEERTPDTAPDPATLTEEKLAAEGRLANMISTIISFMEHYGGKKNNLIRLLYFKCFATESILNICKDKLYQDFSINEQEAFKAINQNFLDFLMTAECRTFQEIDITALKTYIELNISDKNTQIKRPLEAKVYQKYLPAVLGNSVSPAAISQQKKHFYEQLGIDTDKGTWAEE